MDLRYNVIQWIHRATRGWSYGEAIVDPRTGEIIKGQVSLGSLRVRQDYLIAEGLLAPYEKGKAGSAPPKPDKMQEMALARLRQLAAHEVGHTLGLQHNYAASTVNRSSVMDYPPPVVMLDGDGVPDLSKAYATGIGEWDKVSITWGYQDFAPGTDEHAALNHILDDAFSRRHLRYLTDQDARPAGSSSSVAHLWDAGANAVDELDRLMKVRGAALRRFGENNIREGAPLATIEDVLVPIYMLHRYQVEAASKLVGGMDYTFALRGDGEAPTQIVAAAEQRRALAAVLATLKPEELALPESLLKIIPPRPVDYPRGREDFKIRTSPAFDALAPAEAAAQQTLQFLFNPQRASRLVEFHARDAANPSLEEVLNQILASTDSVGTQRRVSRRNWARGGPCRSLPPDDAGRRRQNGGAGACGCIYGTRSAETEARRCGDHRAGPRSARALFLPCGTDRAIPEGPRKVEPDASIGSSRRPTHWRRRCLRDSLASAVRKKNQIGLTFPSVILGAQESRAATRPGAYRADASGMSCHGLPGTCTKCQLQFAAPTSATISLPALLHHYHGCVRVLGLLQRGLRHEAIVLNVSGCLHRNSRGYNGCRPGRYEA